MIGGHNSSIGQSTSTSVTYLGPVGNGLTARSHESDALILNGFAYWVGENVLRPVIDYSISLGSHTYSWFKQRSSALDAMVSLPFPMAEAKQTYGLKERDVYSDECEEDKVITTDTDLESYPVSNHYHFPSEETIVAYLSQYPSIREDDYISKKGIISIAAKCFADADKDAKGIKDGVKEVLNRFSVSQLNPLNKDAFFALSKHLEKALQDCANGKVFEVIKKKVKINNPDAYSTMTLIDTVEDVKPFFDRIVAYCTSADKSAGYKDYGYPIDADQSIKFGHIDTTRYLGELAYHIDRLLKPTDEIPTVFYHVMNQRLEGHEWFMRLATRDEVEKIRKVIRAGVASFPSKTTQQAMQTLDKHLSLL